MLHRPLLLRGQWAARSCGWSCGWLGMQQVGQPLHTPPPGSLPESRSRASPDEPRVGVGVVILRLSPNGQGRAAPEVVLIQRGKPPDKGKWSFPGGSLELGETMVECAVREAAEETGLVLRNGADAGPLAQPHPFTAADVIVRTADGHIQYHYAIVEMSRLMQPEGGPGAGLSKNIARISREAAERFFNA